jgi:endonuclease YncB( thermonuclease family)
VHHKKHSAKGSVTLNGEVTEVLWTDGDSFKVKSGQFDGSGTRLQGYNTLEAYGPVHRWGDWSAQELFALAEESAPHAAQKRWQCLTDGKKDGYGRLLVSCPDLTRAMIGDGYAMVYSVDETPVDKELLALQQEAMKNKAGMWRKGAPKGVITSLHSLGEADSKDSDTAYNRVADTRTGAANKRMHQHRYDTCEEVCEETDGDKSCMIYVPFEKRYKNRPACLQ